MGVKIYQPEGLVFSDNLSGSESYFLQLTVQISHTSFTGCRRPSLKSDESDSESTGSVLQMWENASKVRNIAGDGRVAERLILASRFTAAESINVSEV